MQKKKHKIRYLSIAEQDITEIIDYISKDSPRAAMTLIDNQISILSDLPEIGKIPNDIRLKRLCYRINTGG